MEDPDSGKWGRSRGPVPFWCWVFVLGALWRQELHLAGSWPCSLGFAGSEEALSLGQSRHNGGEAGRSQSLGSKVAS